MKMKKKNKENGNKRSRISIPKITATDNASQAELIWQKKRLRRTQLKDKSTKTYQRKSGRKSGNMH